MSKVTDILEDISRIDTIESSVPVVNNPTSMLNV